MGAEVGFDVLWKVFAGARTILRPVSVVTHSYIVIGSDVRCETY